MIARKLNINQSSINASRFANATLQEIKDMLESKIQDQPQNKDVERQTPEQKNNSSWFRYFAIRNFEESIDPKYDFDKLINHQTLILGWDFDDWQKDFLAQFDELRLKAKYINVIHGDDLSKIRNSHIILVIPQQGDLYKHSDIERRLMILAKLNNLDFDSLLSLNVIHFGSYCACGGP